VNRLFCLLTLATLTSLAAARAAEQTITFAVPEVDGRISLGVYDANKKLVRTLATDATEENFKIGLNGLITIWDGKNDAGEPLPAGKYDVKGYVVSDSVKSEGEAFHFNDWVTDEDDPRLASPVVVHAKGPRLVLAGDAVLGGYEPPDKQTDWKLMVSFTEPDKLEMATDGLTDEGQPAAYKLLKIKKPQLSPAPGVNNAVAEPMQLKDSNGAMALVSDGKSVRIKNETSETPVPLAENLAINSICFGVGETFWLIGQVLTDGVPGPTVIRQYSFKGELLRQIAGEFPATAIVADTTENRIYLTHVEGPTTTIKGLRPLAVATAPREAAEPAATATPAPVTEPTEAPKQADWEVFLEKTSTLCPKFGLVDGKLVADAGATEQKDGVRLELPPSTMDQKQHTLVVHVKATKEGELWATGSGGLRLALVGKLPGTDRVVVAKGEKPGEIKVYAGNGVVVAEYLVSGLNEIAEINAGEIELP